MSRPLQVVLAAAVVFAALWFVALRPKPDSGSSSSAPAAPAAQPAKPRQPGTSLPAGLNRSARAPTAAAKAAPGARSPTSGATAGAQLQSGVLALLPAALLRNATARGAPARHAAPARPHRTRAREGASPAAVTGALTHGKVVVLLFWDRRGSDDRLVRSELRRVSNHHGRALVTAAPIRSVSQYGAVTRGVQVLQSPTVLVIDRARRARILTGYTDAAEIGQAVSEALTLR